MKAFDPSQRLTAAELINLPRDHVIGFMLAVDEAVTPAGPQGGPRAPSEVVVQERFA